MRMHSLSSRSRAVVCGTAAALVSVSAVTGSSLTAAAQTNTGVQGSTSVFAVPGTFHIQQLSVGSDGKLWFVTPQSQLGTISSSGQAALTGVVLPHGNVPAVVAGAGPEGVWSYGQNDTAIYSKGTCALDLVTSDNVVHPVTLPSVAAQSFCGGAAADGSGNLWVSLSNQCGSRTCGQRVSFVVEITPALVVTLFPPAAPGVRAGPVALASDGAIWALGGYPHQQLGRYTPSGSSTGIQIATGELTGMLARPDGTFWGWRPILCIGQTTEFCLRVSRFSAGGATSSTYLFPVGINLNGPDQLGVSSDGSLWRAGNERTEPDRFFRMAANGTIDRSAAFPTAGGSVLRDDGTLAVTGSGAIWSSAQSSSGAEYLLRFQPV
jgi:streptogramin lyase